MILQKKKPSMNDKKFHKQQKSKVYFGKQMTTTPKPGYAMWNFLYFSLIFTKTIDQNAIFLL